MKRSERKKKDRNKLKKESPGKKEGNKYRGGKILMELRGREIRMSQKKEKK